MLSIIAGVLTVAIVVGLLTNWYGFYGAGGKILSSTKKLLKSESFTVEIETFTQRKGSTTSKGATSTVEIDIDFDNKDLTLVLFNSDGKITAAVYDRQYIRYRASKDAYYHRDASDDIEKFFRSYESMGKLDLEAFLLNLGGEELYEKVDDTMYLDRMKWSVLSVYRKFNSDAWLTEHTGYSCQKSNGITEYRFKPDLYGLCETLLAEFEDDFRDGEDFREVEDNLEDYKKTLTGFDFDAAIGIKSGKLSTAELSAENGILKISVKMKITKAGNTHIDTNTLNEILSKSTRKD